MQLLQNRIWLRAAQPVVDEGELDMADPRRRPVEYGVANRPPTAAYATLQRGPFSGFEDSGPQLIVEFDAAVVEEIRIDLASRSPSCRLDGLHASYTELGFLWVVASCTVAAPARPLNEFEAIGNRLCEAIDRALLPRLSPLERALAEDGQLRLSPMFRGGVLKPLRELNASKADQYYLYTDHLIGDSADISDLTAQAAGQNWSTVRLGSNSGRATVALYVWNSGPTLSPAGAHRQAWDEIDRFLAPNAVHLMEAVALSVGTRSYADYLEAVADLRQKPLPTMNWVRRRSWRRDSAKLSALEPEQVRWIIDYFAALIFRIRLIPQSLDQDARALIDDAHDRSRTAESFQLAERAATALRSTVEGLESLRAQTLNGWTNQLVLLLTLLTIFSVSADVLAVVGFEPNDPLFFQRARTAKILALGVPSSILLGVILVQSRRARRAWERILNHAPD